jgi:hypothetical protein
MECFIYHYTLLASAALLLAACGPSESDEEAEQTVLRFAETYFGCHYKEAAQLCTPSSEKWIRFVATNVTDSDLIVLNQSDVEPQYEVDDLNAIDDSTMTATIEANHYFHLHDIGQKADIKEADTYTFTLRRINGQWKIDLASVPRPTSQPQ